MLIEPPPNGFLASIIISQSLNIIHMKAYYHKLFMILLYYQPSQLMKLFLLPQLVKLPSFSTLNMINLQLLIFWPSVLMENHYTPINHIQVKEPKILLEMIYYKALKELPMMQPVFMAQLHSLNQPIDKFGIEMLNPLPLSLFLLLSMITLLAKCQIHSIHIMHQPVPQLLFIILVTKKLLSDRHDNKTNLIVKYLYFYSL